LFTGATTGTTRYNAVFVRDLGDPAAKVVELLPDFDANYAFVDNEGTAFFFRTDQGAPNGRLIAIDTRNPGRAAWREIVPEGKDALVRVSLVHDTFIASYLKDITTAVRLFAMDGKPLGEVKLPGLGAASGFGGKRGEAVTYYSFTGFTTPGTIFRFDVAARTSAVFREPKLKADLAGYETKQVFYTSKDGTRVPMFLSNRKGIKIDGNNPVLLYAYGGFDIPSTPSFSVANLVWMEMGGVYALANLRGGGEYGEAWHEAGMFERKQNVFDDFIAAGEWLIANGYTSKNRLAIFGGSNGGLLVGAVLNQRPDLFGAAIPAVGVMDMLRYQKFTIGWAWASEYGTADDPKLFPALRAYSPLHNVKTGGCYPPTLVTTADHDDRVFPAHSFKYAATLQAAQGCANPVLIRIETRAGHGAGKPTAKQINEAADRLAFLVKSLGMQTPKF
jgi:prolyl oligopeptidase